MNAGRRRHAIVVTVLLLGTGAATALVLQAFEENVLFFFSPSDVLAGKAPAGREFRMGGVVEGGSVVRGGDGLSVRFRVTDLGEAVTVHYRGILPDLFREGQGVVVRGYLDGGGEFGATEVLARHDENYMPPEAAAALRATHTLGQGGP